MFKKVLVANRGEIAVRVIRACRELGIPTVAIYSEADAESLHVRLATDAYCIGPNEPSKSYLNIPAIMSAAVVSGADAIHPGYGFLSERPDFVDICDKHNIKFIGPSGNTMRLMGDKANARKTMIENDVPVTPGTGILSSIKEGLDFANKVGYPIIIKATAGGGGKAMRVVRNSDELPELMNICQQEAENYFGNPDVYAEKFLENPRHIEVQIISDKYGNVVHVGERDCSIQRRHQKLIEEAPSFVVDEKTRKAMGEAAVEHCVTEMISRIDLVRQQIRVAAGEELEYTQKDIKLVGHAIECRINAENADKNFIPCPGKIEGYAAPGGFGIRVDSHVYPGYKIPPYYDSLIGKLICWGQTRNEARRRMYQALKEYVITGIETTIPFHLEIVEDEVFKSGNFNTGYIEDYLKRTHRI